MIQPDRRALPASTVFTRVDARALGWSDESVTRAVAAGRVLRLRHGYFAVAPAGPADLDALADLSALAAARACRGSVISHRSALRLYGLPVLGRSVDRPELTVAPRRIGSLTAAHLHRAALPDRDVRELNGHPVTSVGRTVIDVARSRPVTASVAAIDAALHRRMVRQDELHELLVRCWNWPGIRRAQRAVALADGRSESPLESVSRLVIAWLRLPQPELQTLVLDGNARPVARLDFYWDEYGVAGEADGRSKYDSRAVLTAEKDRQERTEDLGVTFARWGWADTTRPHLLGSRIQRAFERGRIRDRSGSRRNWSVRRTEPTG